MARTVPLPCGHEAIVDDEDWERVRGFAWRHHHGRNHVSANVGGRNLMLHRLVLQVSDGELVDHRFGDGSGPCLSGSHPRRPPFVHSRGSCWRTE
jgi:hypothetical protein